MYSGFGGSAEDARGISRVPGDSGVARGGVGGFTQGRNMYIEIDGVENADFENVQVRNHEFTCPIDNSFEV